MFGFLSFAAHHRLYMIKRYQRELEDKLPSEKPPVETTSGSDEGAHLDSLLDEALNETFPASDPIAIQIESETSTSSIVDLSGVLARAILSTPSDAIIAADREGIIRFWNFGAERIFGFLSAEAIGQQYPQYATQITAAAKASFLSGDQWAYTAGIVAIILGAVLVFFMFPKKDDEQRLLVAYHAEDVGRRRDVEALPSREGP